MMGEEKEMFEKHEDLLQNQVLPDIDTLKKVTALHEQNIKELRETAKEFNNRFDTLKNMQDSTQNQIQSVDNNLKQIGMELKEQNSKLFTHVLEVDKQRREHRQALTLANLDMKGKIIVAVLGSSSLVLAGYTIYEKLTGG
jgi:antitoxin component YwqK of YwqJK toxin-antitoxin module